MPKIFYLSNKAKSSNTNMKNVSIARCGKEHLEVQINHPNSILRYKS